MTVVSQDLEHMVTTTVLTIYNDSSLHHRSLELYKSGLQPSFQIRKEGLRLNSMHEQYQALSSRDRATVRQYINIDLKAMFYDQLNPTDNVEKTMPPTTAELNFVDVVEPRAALIFGVDITKKNKNSLMTIIRKAREQADTFRDLANESKYASDQITNIEEGIKLCLIQLDK